MKTFLTLLIISSGLIAPASALTPSAEAKAMCIYYETGGEGYYTARLQRPTVPPAPSGITIGCGYDLGYNTAARIAQDWSPHLIPAQIRRLQSVAGLQGAAAKAALPRVRDILVPWSAAMAVHDSRTTPRFIRLTESAYPGILQAHPHIQGVILSTTFNRGTAMDGDRRRELRWTRDDIAAARYADLPSYQLQMRRLWPAIPGLQKRYAAHAGLIQRAIDQTTPPP
jgi:hypothetical protein